MRVVITGANRGLGLEFVRQYLERDETVVATVRDVDKATELAAIGVHHPGKLTILGCDVSDEASVKKMAAEVRGPVDILVNNAGVGGSFRAMLKDLDVEDMMKTFRINALGAIMVTRALLPNLTEGSARKIAHITSRMGSIGDNTSGGAYGYRMSKAALNMASVCLALELRSQKIISVVLNPGWVLTDMGGPSAPTPPATSISGMISVIDGLTLEKSGAFLDYRGPTAPW